MIGLHSVNNKKKHDTENKVNYCLLHQTICFKMFTSPSVEHFFQRCLDYSGCEATQVSFLNDIFSSGIVKH